MAQNPLQSYFRQPKIYLSLPSLGAYNAEGEITGNFERLPVYGMTGMDEIMLKTPDALITGESTVKVIQSCCPDIKDGWAVTNLDIDAILVAIRIATYGATMTVSHTCQHCKEENSYDVDVSKFLDHFQHCKFDPKVVIGDLLVKLRPLSYKQISDYNAANFGLQRQLYKTFEIENEEEKQAVMAKLFAELSELQNNVLTSSIESVEMPTTVVTEREFIREWLANTGKEVYDSLKAQIDVNNKTWKIPTTHVNCDSCGGAGEFTLEMDQANFFVKA